MLSVASADRATIVTRRSPLRFLREAAAVLGLILSDAAAFTLGYYLFRYGHQMPAFALPTGFSRPDPADAVDIYLIMGVLFILIRYMLGDYARRQPFWDGARGTTNTLLLVSVPDVLLIVLVGNSALYLPLITSWAFLIVAVPVFRQAARLLLSAIGVWRIRTALIGSGAIASDALESLSTSLALGFDVHYFLADGDPEIPEALQGLQRLSLGSPTAAVAELREAGCGQAIVVADNAAGPGVAETIQRLIGANIQVAIIPSLRGLPLFGLSTSYIFGKDLLLLQVRNNLARSPSRLVKRVVDLVGPLVLLAVFSPVLLAIAIAIKLDDGGPIFFVQRRVGRGGRSFPCLKFRTMRVDAEDMLARWPKENPALYREYIDSNFKLRDDPRVTRVGRILRRISFDELPQLANVLVGDMSLVGPRPLLEREVGAYGVAFQLYQRMNPGITGLWQISGRTDTRFADRVSYDEWYVLNWSLWYDLVILIRTAWVVLARKGAF